MYFYVLETNNSGIRFKFQDIKDKIKECSDMLLLNYDDSKIESELKNIIDFQEQNELDIDPFYIKRQIDFENRLCKRLMENLKSLNQSLDSSLEKQKKYIECFRLFLKNYRAFAVYLHKIDLSS
ncbi:hypothetical protein HERIO_982 [Hepatospora eriocheir]|uniref:Uncharacterized protein n=1 Tax=Hepatospora eriocheir TaxID=1081669 RepID=A0A1X0QBP5_9MICR|nr:hypothetical protein HERIO_982 [Hepatospora eriocheir]